MVDDYFFIDELLCVALSHHQYSKELQLSSTRIPAVIGSTERPIALLDRPGHSNNSSCQQSRQLLLSVGLYFAEKSVGFLLFHQIVPVYQPELWTESDHCQDFRSLMTKARR